eukprot:UN27129
MWYTQNHTAFVKKLASQHKEITANAFPSEIEGCKSKNGVLSAQEFGLKTCFDKKSSDWMCVFDFDEIFYIKGGLQKYFKDLEHDQISIIRRSYLSDVCTAKSNDFPEFERMIYTPLKEPKGISRKVGAFKNVQHPKSCHRVENFSGIIDKEFMEARPQHWVKVEGT